MGSHSVSDSGSAVSMNGRKSTITGARPMTDEKKTTQTTEVKTETKRDSDGALNTGYKKEETTVKTERTVEKEKEPIIIIEEH